MTHKHEHQAPSGEYNRIDYTEKMDDLIFNYDKDFYPIDEDLPDPQVNPIIPGAGVSLDKVGIGPVDLPIKVYRRDGKTQPLQATASLYCSLDDPKAKGLNLSRLYILMHETIKDHVSIEGISSTLEEMAEKQGSKHAYCKLRFKYPMTQKALRSRQPLTDAELESGDFQELDNGEKISFRKAEGHIAYNVVLEGQYHKGEDEEFKYFLTTEYLYSSTCPCSFELAHNATRLRAAAANAHSQRSIMKTTVEFNIDDMVFIEDLIELQRQHIPTEVQIYCKRRDEQAQAELNGANMLFAEDAVRIMVGALEEWYSAGKIYDFSVVSEHIESLHPWSAIALYHKHNDITPK